MIYDENSKSNSVEFLKPIAKYYSHNISKPIADNKQIFVDSDQEIDMEEIVEYENTFLDDFGDINIVDKKFFKLWNLFSH